jgi:hypothetical protein
MTSGGATAEEPQAAVAATGGRRRALVSALALVVVLIAFGWSLAGRWSEVGEQLGSQHPGVLVAALLTSLAGVYFSFLLWRGTLAVLGTRLAVRPAARLFFVSQLGKYLPGAVWPVLAQMRMGKELGVPRQRMGLAFLLTLGLATLVGLVLAVAALPALLEAEGRAALWVLAALPFVLVLFVPAFVNRLLGLALRVVRRPGLERPLSAREIAEGTAWSLLFWLVYGGHVWLLVLGLGGDPWRSLPVAIGGFALAFSLGPLLVVLPAGAGVREAVLIVLLGTVLTTPAATAVALTSRLILMVTDGVLALAAALAARRSPRRAAP